jgi:hypothetical protein
MVTRTGRAFHKAAFAAAMVVGALQMYHVRGGFLTNYGADFFGTAWVYATMRIGGTVVQRGRAAEAWSSALTTFALCVAWELGQRLHWIPGRFDPFDIVTYGVAVVACLAIDRIAPLAFLTA